MKKKLIIVILTILVASQAWAAAPVEDLTRSGRSSQGALTQRLTTEQRLRKLEQQLENINRLNQSEKIENLNSTIQTLQGIVEKQTHDLKILSEQQKQFYQDLDRRLQQTAQTTTTPISTTPTVTANNNADTSQNTPVVSEGEQKVYKDAFELLKSKKYDEALKAMTVYITKYPQGQYVVNAYYWTGEIYYLQGKAESAKMAFKIIVKNFPTSQKLPDALLKLAIIDIDAGHNEAAKNALLKIQQLYPGTTAARLAGIRYQELKLNS